MAAKAGLTALRLAAAEVVARPDVSLSERLMSPQPVL